MNVCPQCGAAVYFTVAYEEVRSMRNPPRQAERYTRYARWQCHRFSAHNGRFSEATDDRPLTELELP